MRGIAITAPASGCGKSVLALALLRAFRNRGVAARAAKSGPDYIDPQFHAAALGRESANLDAWAMGPVQLGAHAAGPGDDQAELLVIEGAMGALDGAGDEGRGSTADLAALLRVPVVMVIDCVRMSHTAPLAPLGFRAIRPEIRLAGVIANRTASSRHRRMVERAFASSEVPFFGSVPRDRRLELEERHLGLVLPGEQPDLERFLEDAARIVEECLDLDAIMAASAPIASAGAPDQPIRPIGQRIAVARDAAFAFIYSHVIAGWRAANAEISFFSPLADEPPDAAADAIFLPGGYPELHAETLAGASGFRQGSSLLSFSQQKSCSAKGGFWVASIWRYSSLQITFR